MYLVSAQGYKNAGVLEITKTNEIWVSMKHVGDGLCITKYLI